MFFTLKFISLFEKKTFTFFLQYGIIIEREGGNNMVVYNLYLVLNDESIMIYDKHMKMMRFEGSSNDIPEILFDRYVHYMTIVRDHKGDYKQLIVID